MVQSNRDRSGGSLMFHMNKQTPSKVLTRKSVPRDIESVLLELPIKNSSVLIYISHHLIFIYFILFSQITIIL